MGSGGPRGLQNRWARRSVGRFDSSLFRKRVSKTELATLPQIEVLLQESEVQRFLVALSRHVVAEIARSTINETHHSVSSAQTTVLAFPRIIEEVVLACLNAVIVNNSAGTVVSHPLDFRRGPRCHG